MFRLDEEGFLLLLLLFLSALVKVLQYLSLNLLCIYEWCYFSLPAVMYYRGKKFVTLIFVKFYRYAELCFLSFSVLRKVF